MTARVRVDRRALERLVRERNGPAGQALRRTAILVEGTAKRLASTPGRGRWYFRTRPDRWHRASAPGDPPAPDLGNLRRSITHELDIDERGLLARVGSPLFYSFYLELGTVKMEPRPFLRPALNRHTRGA